MTDLRRVFDVYPSDRRATVPLGIRVNDTVYASVAGVDPVSGDPGGDVRGQMSVALDRLDALLGRAGCGLDNVARATVFVTSAEDREPAYEPWEALFPDAQDRPAFKALTADLPAGRLVRLDAVALAGERRTRIDIPNVRARDPSVRIGNWFFTSRCHGHDPATGEVVAGGVEAETAQTLDNLATLVGLAGGAPASIVQLTMFGREAGYIPVARRVFEERFPDPAERPQLHQLVNFISGRFEVAIEMVAVI